MKLLFYYIIHTFKNSIKKIFKTWVVWLILFFVVCGVIGGVTAAIVSNSSEKNSSTQQQVEQQEDSKKEWSAEDKAFAMNVVELAIGGIALAVVLINLYSGDKSGSSIFTMADVNLLFASPMKPQSILMFRVLLQMGLILVGSLYMIGQLPNIIINLKLSLFDGLIMLLTWVLILIFGNLIGVCTYTITATHQKLKRYVRPLTITIVSVIGLCYVGTMYFGKMDAFTAAVTLFNSKASRLIPIWGWFKGVVMYAIEGNFQSSLLSVIGIIVGCVLFTFLIWHIKADFYEDAFNNANERQEKLTAALEGRRVGKERSAKILREGIGRGEGANIFFIKSLYNRRRSAKLGLFTNTSITYLMFCVLLAVITRFWIKTDDMTMLSCVMLGLVFFRNSGSPLASETQYNFIYMVPESPYKKLVYSLLAGSYDAFMNILPGFLIAVIIIGANPISALCWIALLITMDFIASSAGLFIDMLLPTFIAPVVKQMMQMMLKMLAVIPTLIILVVGVVLSAFLPAVAIASIANLVIGFGLFMLSPRFLHAGRN